MGVVTGRRSRLSGVATYRSASINQQINLQELRHAGTKGGPQRLVGVEDWDGSYEEYGMVPSWFPGKTYFCKTGSSYKGREYLLHAHRQRTCFAYFSLTTRKAHFPFYQKRIPKHFCP